MMALQLPLNKAGANAVHHAVLFLHRGGHLIFKIKTFKNILLERVCDIANQIFKLPKHQLGKEGTAPQVCCLIYKFMGGYFGSSYIEECWKMTIHISAGKMKKK